MLQELRYAFRILTRAPGFAVTALLTLALGIGLATAVFTVAHTLLLRRLPVDDQDRLVVLWGEAPDRAFNYSLALDDAREFARRVRSVERVAFFSYYGAVPKPIRDGDQISRLSRTAVSGEFFEVLGARPVVGRALRAADDVTGAAPVAVLSYGIWPARRRAHAAAARPGRYQASADRVRVRGGAASSDNVHQCREPAPGAWSRTGARNRRAIRAWRGPPARHPPTVDRERTPRGRRRGAGCCGGCMDGPDLRRFRAGRSPQPGRN